MHPWYYDDDKAWLEIDPDDTWIFDKLIISRKLGYECGPVGVAVKKPGNYIVRPCVNFCGMGLGAIFVNIEKETLHLPPGHFWCEIFKGRHLSIDYNYGEQILCVEGLRNNFVTELTKWSAWRKVNKKLNPPKDILEVLKKYEYSNCEFIGGKLIEIHLRRNPNFYYAKEEYIPVYNRATPCPKGFRYLEDPDGNGIRHGAFIK